MAGPLTVADHLNVVAAFSERLTRAMNNASAAIERSDPLGLGEFLLDAAMASAAQTETLVSAHKALMAELMTLLGAPPPADPNH